MKKIIFIFLFMIVSSFCFSETYAVMWDNLPRQAKIFLIGGYQLGVDQGYYNYIDVSSEKLEGNERTLIYLKQSMREASNVVTKASVEDILTYVNNFYSKEKNKNKPFGEALQSFVLDNSR